MASVMEPYYDAKQISELLHKQPDTIRKMISHGDFGETLNSGKRRLVSESNLKAYITGHTGQVQSKRRYVVSSRRSSHTADCMARL